MIVLHGFFLIDAQVITTMTPGLALRQASTITIAMAVAHP
jgi:hypothetical protein